MALSLLSDPKNRKHLQAQAGKISMMKCIYAAACLGLYPDPSLGLIYFIPFKGIFTIIPGYQGLAELMYRSGQVSTVQAEVVHRNDHFDFQLGSAPKITHRPHWIAEPGSEPGPLISAYCVVTMRDRSKHLTVMSIDEVHQRRDRSAGYRHDKQGSTWSTDYEAMCRKTPVRQASKTLPKLQAPELAQVVTYEDEVDAGKPQSLPSPDADPMPEGERKFGEAGDGDSFAEEIGKAMESTD